MNKEAIESMIATIELEARATASYTGRSEFKPSVLKAMSNVPREEFVAPSLCSRAYDNTALSIDCGQTISQPYIVALMTDLLDTDDNAVVLEIGAGSGYQAAVVSEIAERVISIELDEELAVKARQRLHRLGYDNVDVFFADGYFGYPDCAPYDGILVTAAISEVPPSLIGQLKVGARLVIPIGKEFYTQDLVVIEKGDEQNMIRQSILPVVFVPFRRA